MRNGDVDLFLKHFGTSFCRPHFGNRPYANLSCPRSSQRKFFVCLFPFDIVIRCWCLFLWYVANPSKSRLFTTETFIIALRTIMPCTNIVLPISSVQELNQKLLCQNYLWTTSMKLTLNINKACKWIVSSVNITCGRKRVDQNKYPTRHPVFDSH